LFERGPEKKRRFALPNVPVASTLNSEVLKYGTVVEWGSPIFNEPGVKFGVSIGSEMAPAPLVPSKEASSVSTRVTGRPLENRVIPLKRHPFTNLLGPPKQSKGLVVVADYKVVPKVEGGERSLTLVQQVDLLAVSRTVVEGLGIRVARQKFQPRNTLANAQLQRIVTGFSTR